MLPWEGRCPGGWGQKTKSCLRDSEKPLIYFVKIMFIDRSPGPCPSEASPDGTVWWTRSRQGQPQDSMHLRANESATLQPVGSDQLVNIPGQGQQRFFQEDEATKLISNKPKLYFLLAEEERGKEVPCVRTALLSSPVDPQTLALLPPGTQRILEDKRVAKHVHTQFVLYGCALAFSLHSKQRLIERMFA